MLARNMLPPVSWCAAGNPNVEIGRPSKAPATLKMRSQSPVAAHKIRLGVSAREDKLLHLRDFGTRPGTLRILTPGEPGRREPHTQLRRGRG